MALIEFDTMSAVSFDTRDRYGCAFSMPFAKFRIASVPHSISPLPPLCRGPSFGTECPKMRFTTSAMEVAWVRT